MNDPDSIHQQVPAHVETVRDMSARVLTSGSEPSYATEKLARALRATIRALILLGWSREDFAEAIDREASP